MCGHEENNERIYEPNETNTTELTQLYSRF